jgi:5-methylcytosine-specific restriction enzyme A
MADWPYCTAAWRKLRLAKLAIEPLCQPCKARGHLTSANTVDHIKPIADGGAAFPPLDQLMSMCARCHNEKTAANDRTHTKPFARKVKGVDANGNPVDPSDGWHTGADARAVQPIVSTDVHEFRPGDPEKKYFPDKSAAAKNGRAHRGRAGGGAQNHGKIGRYGPVGESKRYLVSGLTNEPADEAGFA